MEQLVEVSTKGLKVPQYIPKKTKDPFAKQTFKTPTVLEEENEFNFENEMKKESNPHEGGKRIKNRKMKTRRRKSKKSKKRRRVSRRR